MATTRTLTGEAGVLYLHLPVGHAHVTVDPAATGITVTLSTTDDTGPSVDALGDATEYYQDGRYVVRVPDIAASVIVDGASTVFRSSNGAGGMTLRQSVGTVYGEVIGIRVNGNRVESGSLGTAGIAASINAEVTIPSGVGLDYQGTSADLTVTGHLASIDVNTVSGDVRLASVGDLFVNTTSGDVDADVVFGPVMVRSVSGDVTVGSYQGSGAHVSSTSGDVRLSAGRDAHGSLRATTVSGDLRLRGTERLTVTAETVSGRKTIA